VGDVLVAMDSDRVEASGFNDRFAEKKIGSKVTFTVLRRDQIRNIEVTIGQEERVTYNLTQKSDATDSQKTIFKSWLKEN
jgi:predicted metalloprotease with PDZ domain